MVLAEEMYVLAFANYFKLLSYSFCLCYGQEASDQESLELGFSTCHFRQNALGYIHLWSQDAEKSRKKAQMAVREQSVVT